MSRDQNNNVLVFFTCFLYKYYYGKTRKRVLLCVIEGEIDERFTRPAPGVPDKNESKNHLKCLFPSGIHLSFLFLF